MSEGNIRTIKINNSGSETSALDVPDDIAPIVNRRRRTNRRKQEGGGGGTAEINSSVINITKDNSTIPVTKLSGGALTDNSATKTNIPPGPRLNSGSVQTPITPIIDAASPNTNGIIRGGQTKVVLKRKNRTSKIILKTKTTSPELSTSRVQGSGSPDSQQNGGSKKKTRRLIVKQVSKRLKKTRHLVKHAKEMPLDNLRKILVMKKLIKPHSKAPESILRQIYADSVIVGKKTL